MKKLITVILSIILVACFLLSACGTPQDKTPPSASASVQPSAAATDQAGEQAGASATDQPSETRAARVDEYAGIVAKAIDVQEGDRIIVQADVLESDFASLVAKKCYEMGAKGVQIMYGDGSMTDLQAKHLKDEEYNGYFYTNALNSYTRSNFPDHKSIQILTQHFDEVPATQEELSNYLKLRGEKSDTFIQEHNLTLGKGIDMHSIPWVVVAYPSKSWAKKVYPELTQEAAFDKLMDDFLDFARVGKSENFFAHVENLVALANKAVDYSAKAGGDIFEKSFAPSTQDVYLGVEPIMPQVKAIWEISSMEELTEYYTTNWENKLSTAPVYFSVEADEKDSEHYAVPIQAQSASTAAQYAPDFAASSYNSVSLDEWFMKLLRYIVTSEVR